MTPLERLADLGRRLPREEGAVKAQIRAELRLVARRCRDGLADAVDAHLGPFDALHLRALREVPRERFVREGDEGRSAEDVPLPLDDVGLSTISAPHAYLLSFRLLELGRRDRLVELGSGSGYGAALAALIVGDQGTVLTLEIDAALHARAAFLLGDQANVTTVRGDAAHSTGSWGAANKVVCTFAVDRLPEAWVRALPEGGSLVAPVAARDRDQVLTRVQKRHSEIVVTEHGGVRYVKNRSPP